MAVKILPRTVADAFVKQYYIILNRCPENAHKFYKESSMLGWPGSDGVVTSVTGSSEISDKILSSAYKHCTVEIITKDAQESLDGGIIIAVTGSLTGKDDVKKNFCQTFFLAKQEKGFYVLNDILRFIDVSNTAADNDDVTDQRAPSVQSSEVEGGKNEKAFARSVSEDTVAEAKADASMPSIASESIASEEKVFSAIAIAPTSNENVRSAVVSASKKKGRSAAKASKKKARAVVKADSNEKVHSGIAPALNENLPEVVEPASTENLPEVAAPASAENLPEVVEPASTENLPEVVAPASTEILSEVDAPASTEDMPEVAATTSTEKEPLAGAPASDEKAPSAVATASTETTTSVVEPDPNEKLPTVDPPASNVTPKITYAYMVAKEAPVSPPRTIRVVTKVIKQRSSSPPAKVSAPAKNNGPDFEAYAEATGIYIGALPYNITKQGIVDVVKKFGPVRRKPDTIQIRRHEDGFCCGFVEFESAGSARRAVEAHRVKFGETEAYIAFKKSSAYRGNDAGRRSPTRAGSLDGWDDEATRNKGQSRRRRRSKASDQ